MTRLFRNPNIKVGDKVRIHAKPLRPVGILSIEPSPEVVGSTVVVTAIHTYENNTSLDYDVDCRFPNGSHDLCDSQFLEVIE